MKVLLTFSLILFTLVSFTQTTGDQKPAKIRCDKVVRSEVTPAKVGDPTETILGDFVIDRYIELGLKTPGPLELDLLIGSMVRIQESSIAGDEIDPMTFTVYEIEKMQSADYIFRVFGDQLKNQIEDLPYSVKVHKTDHSECYGIIALGASTVVMPYKGTLLFLKRK